MEHRRYQPLLLHEVVVRDGAQMQHDRRLEIEGLGPVHLKEGQYNLLYAPSFDISSLHEAGKEYITMSLQFDRDALQEWSAFFPPLTAFLVGAAAASSYGPYYGRPAYAVTPGYRTCNWVRQFDAYGNYVGKACVY